MDRLRVIVAGLAGQHPVGGVAFDYLQYVIGLSDLGHDVWYHEDTWSWPYDPVRRTISDTGDYSAGFIDGFFRQHAPELRERWHYVHDHTTHYGMTAEAFDEVARGADLFLNISGASMLPAALSSRATTVFVDTDPGYNQIVYTQRPDWSANVDRWVALVDAHDRHATFAENIGAPDCLVPDTGHDWIPTRSPIVSRLWDDVPPPVGDAPWTTVMTWNAFAGPLVLDGLEYGSKGVEFERIIDLPRLVDDDFAVAVGGIDAPLERLSEHGWAVRDGPTATLTTDDYRGFIAGSFGEVSTAKNVYAALRTGWFSCRTACYLAAGRPAVVQDTGLSSSMPLGEGLHAFSDLGDAVTALRHVRADPTNQSRAAKGFAADHLDAAIVLPKLIDDVLGPSRLP